MNIRLSDHFDYRRLIRFTIPSVGTMLFMSIYGVVDGFFVSNFVGKTAFAAVNLIIPATQVLGGVGAMLGVGGSALTAKTLGEGDAVRAGRYLTMMVKLMLITSVATSALGLLLLRPIARLFGATDELMQDCLTYGTICMLFGPAMHAQYTLQGYLLVAEKPKLQLYVTLFAGCSNMVLDALFMGVFRMGVAGAALATGLSQCIGGAVPFFWLRSRHNRSPLRFEPAKIELRVMLKACGNGASEMLSNMSASITGMLYNRQLMAHAGADGVAAYGTIMYVGFVFIAVFFGYSSGASPIMSYHYGAENRDEMKNVYCRSLRLLGGASLVLTAVAVLFARPLAGMFVGYDARLCDMTARAFKMCAPAFLIMWLNVYASSMFTALNDGRVSAIISFMHALVFPVLCILLLPALWGLDGVWFALVGAELLSAFVSVAYLVTGRARYGY